MSDTVKLIVEIPKSALKLLNTTGVDWLDAEHILSAVAHGIPLDDVKAEIDYERNLYLNLVGDSGYCNGLNKALKIIDSIGKESSEQIKGEEDGK